MKTLITALALLLVSPCLAYATGISVMFSVEGGISEESATALHDLGATWVVTSTVGGESLVEMIVPDIDTADEKAKKVLEDAGLKPDILGAWEFSGVTAGQTITFVDGEPVVEGEALKKFKPQKYLRLMPDECTTDPETEEVTCSRPTVVKQFHEFYGWGKRSLE